MRKHKGFTLVELVVVIMILGILAAVAAPKLLSTSANATDNGVRQTLSIVRDAIERYAAEHGGERPGEALTEADFKTDLRDYVRGQFPACPVGLTGNTILVIGPSPDESLPLPGDPAPTPSHSWKYCRETGEFIVNTQQLTNNDDDSPLLQYDQL